MDIKTLLKERDVTQGSILKNILAMTWPLWFNSGVWIIFSGLNIYWVSKIGTDALAAVTAGGVGYMLLMTPVLGIVTSVYGLIGNLAGVKDWVGAERKAKEIMAITWFLSLAVAFLGYFFAPILLKFIGIEEKVLVLAVTYLRIQAAGGIISFSLWVINTIIRSSGDMMRPMAVMFIVNVLNIVFDWFFILGNLGFPRWEVAGAAFASAASASVGAVIGFGILVWGNSPIKINLKEWRGFKINLLTLKEVFKIAGFDVLEMSGKVVIDLLLLRCIAFWGTASVAVYGIGQRLLKMSSTGGYDLGMTTAIVMANNLGAGKKYRAERSAWFGTALNIFIMAIAGLAFFIFADKVMGFYSGDPQVVDIGINYLKITAFGYLFIAMTVVLRRAFAGAKNTRIPALVTLLIMGIGQIGLAVYLPKIFGLGVAGVWWAILIATTINGLILAALFKFKPSLWKRN